MVGGRITSLQIYAYLQLALFPLLMCLQDQPYYADCRSSCLEQWLAKPTICQLTPLSSPQWLVSVFISNFYFQTEFFQVGCTFFSSLRPLFWVQKLLSESRVCLQTAERSREEFKHSTHIFLLRTLQNDIWQRAGTPVEKNLCHFNQHAKGTYCSRGSVMTYLQNTICILSILEKIHLLLLSLLFL